MPVAFGMFKVISLRAVHPEKIFPVPEKLTRVGILMVKFVNAVLFWKVPFTRSVQFGQFSSTSSCIPVADRAPAFGLMPRLVRMSLPLSFLQLQKAFLLKVEVFGFIIDCNSPSRDEQF